MLRLKKAKEEAAAATAASTSAVNTPTTTTPVESKDTTETAMQVDDNTTQPSNTESGENPAEEGGEGEGTGGISLLGIGGKQVKGAPVKKGKKRTPGELRIQKGNVYHLFCFGLF